MKELVSVIVPIYNVEKYLDKCVETLRVQSYKNIEIILVDDGSTDSCPTKCDNYAKADHRIHVIHKPNGGLSDARNAGIEIAKGEYFAFVDADDYISQQFIETLLNLCIKEKCDISQCASVDVYDDNGITEFSQKAPQLLSGYNMIKRIYTDCSVDTIVIWSKLYRSKLFDDIRFPVGKLHEDEFTDYKLFDKCKKIAITDSKLYFYRANPSSIVRSNYNLRRLDIFDALNERIDYLRKKGYDELVSMTKAAYVKQLIINIKELKNLAEVDLYKRLICELKKLFFKVLRDKYVPCGYKLMLIRMLWF